MSKRVKIILICVVILAVAAASVFAVRHFLLKGNGGDADTDAVFVESVSDIMGLSAGMSNVFSGVVESPESWSVQKNDEYTVKEVYVSVGDKVEVGTPLFAYDTAEFNKELAQGEIDLERLNNELATMEKVLKQLESAMSKASGNDKANYEIQIEEQKLEIKQKKIDISGKEIENEKLKKNVDSAEVKSGMAGIVRKVQNENTAMGYGDGADNAFITVMQVEDLRIKGTVNEQNIYNVQEGMPVLVRSRVDANKTWRGEVSKIDTEGAQGGNEEMGEQNANASSNYSFYISVDDSEGLILGQHVTIVPQEETADDGKLRLYEYYIDLTEPEAPFVWADEDGKLVKRLLTLGEYDEAQMTYVVESGLTVEDRIAFPDESYAAGQKTTDVMMVTDDEGDMEDMGAVADDMGAIEGEMMMEEPGGTLG